MAMSSSFLRKAAVAVAGGGVYVGASLLMYQYLTAGQKNFDETSSQVSQGFSYVEDPHRTQRFQKIADIYDSQIGRDEAFMGINLLRRMLLWSHARGTVLEVGAGTGRNINFYPSSVQRVVLTDSSDQMLDQAKTKLKNRQDWSRFACMQADAEELGFPDSCFDTVVDTFGLCSFDDPVAVLREMKRVCKEDGKILLLEHGRSKTWQSLSKYLDKHAERHAKNWGCVWNRDLDSILEEAGLDLDRVDTYHFGTTYYVVCNKPEKGQSREVICTTPTTEPEKK